ncbi:unnamed protein product [Rotaria sp. Silwood2]|nr:unnamed protein product [Rotaria sp. Silwood2]CAF4646530.1 unnamed protein product [Rotaria sp. Silwood2]
MVDLEFGLSVYNEQPLIHFVLGCTDRIWKRKGIHRLIHANFVQEIQQYQQENLTKFLIWHATVTPFVTRFVADFYMDVQPADDEHGGYDPRYVPVIEQIQKKMNWQLDDRRNMNKNKHPFVLYGISKNVFYTDEELERIQQFKSNSKDRYNLFDRFQLDIRNGDRILYLSRVTDKKIEFIPNLDKNI